MAARRFSRGYLPGLAVCAAAGVLALPLVPRADPTATPSPGAASQPLTVTKPEASDAAARRMAARERILDARLERLHAALQLSPAQEPLWGPIADAVRGFAKARGVGFRERLDAAGNSNDGLRMQGDHMAKVGVAISQIADATKPLLASLSPDQKSRLPTLLERGPARKVMARAFELPKETGVSGKGVAGVERPVQSGGSASAGQAAATSQPQKASPPADPDDDD